MTVCMFPGQGSQTRGMGRDLFAQYPDLVEAASDLLGYAIAELCLEDPRRELSQTEFTQPALFVVNALSFRQWREVNGEPSALIGHSLGEFNALEAAGAMDFITGLRLVATRGALMAKAPEGAMAAVIGQPADQVRRCLDKTGLDTVDIANLNSPTQVIISGLKSDVAKAQDFVEADGARFVSLNTSGAFHSRYMAQARTEFEKTLAQMSFTAPSHLVIANATAEPYQTAEITTKLATQLTSPVRWEESIRFLLAQGEERFDEVGPGKVLTRIVAEIKASAEPMPTASRASASAEAINPVFHRSVDTGTLRLRIAEWNSTHPIGSRVRAVGQPGLQVTRSEAMILFGHRAALYLEGFNGYFPLDDVSAA